MPKPGCLLVEHPDFTAHEALTSGEDYYHHNIHEYEPDYRQSRDFGDPGAYIRARA